MDQILDQALAVLNSASGQVFIIGGVIDFVLRLIPSERPLSVIHAIAGASKKIGEVLVKFGTLLDKVLPQKLK